MKAEEARRLYNCCLPKLVDHPTSSSTNKDNDRDFNEQVDRSVPLLQDGDSVSATRICDLWSGMGAIYRLTMPTQSAQSSSFLKTLQNKSIAVKHIPSPLANPNNNNNSVGDRRKALAYHVEANFYEHVAPLLVPLLRLPTCYYLERSHDSITMCLEWIGNCSTSFESLSSRTMIQATLSWLATLHASYWGRAYDDQTVLTEKLQPIGSYWHLDTRSQEHANMLPHGWQGRLKRAARAVDACLKRDSMQCLIHGDCKDANILVTTNSSSSSSNNQQHDENDTHMQVTLVDFQYTGRGPPTRDLAYFFASSVDTDQHDEDELLEYYYHVLVQQLDASVAPTLAHLKDSLDLAYCDFLRFQCGWGFWGTPLEARVQDILSKLDHGVDLKSEEAYDKAIRDVYW